MQFRAPGGSGGCARGAHSFLAPTLLLAALVAIVLAFVALADTVLVARIVLARYGSRQGKLLQEVGTRVGEFLCTRAPSYFSPASLTPPPFLK